ncbi:MAG: DUF11 domain-containing protein [Planctomycetota bacterium]|nr:MAG: DUF11 domain-containing protein [Planctomycetota bacterium]
MSSRILGLKSESKTANRAKSARFMIEHLEAREVLATYIVTSALPDLLATTAGSLNNCIVLANSDPTPDKIIFSDTLSADRNGLINIDAKWLRRITSQIAFDGLELPDGTSRTNVQVVLNGPKDTSPSGYNIGSSVLEFVSGSSDSSARGINFLNNNGSAVSATNVDRINISQSYFGLASTGGVKGPNGAGVIFAGVNNGRISGNNLNYNRGAAISVSGTGNLIQGNSLSNNGAGIVIAGNGAGNSISGNSVYLNSGTGIEIGANANAGMKAPVLTEVTLSSQNSFFARKTLNVKGNLVGLAPNSSYNLQFFATPSNSTLTPANAQGRYYFQFYDLKVATDGNGNASFNQAINASQAANAGAPVNLSDYVTATATKISDGSSSGFSNTQQVVRQLTADLSIDMIADPNPVDVGTMVEFTMNVNNTGPDAASSVQMVDQLNPAFTFVSASSTQGIISVDANNKLTADLGNVDAVRTVQIKVQVRANQTGLFSNTASVITPTFDTDKTNNSATTNITILPNPKADLFLEATFIPSVIPIGEETVYSIVVNNNGPEIARGVTTVTHIGSGVSFVNASNDHGTVTFDPKTNLLYSTMGAVEVAGKAILTIHVRGELPQIVTFDSTVTTTSQELAPITNKISSDLTVVDVPGKIQFPNSIYRADENTVIQIPVTRSEGTLGDAQVYFSTVDGTAIAGVDYVPLTNYLVNFPDGDTSTQYVSVTLLQAPNWDVNKSLGLQLTDASGAILGIPANAVLNIKNTHSAPVGTIQLGSVTPPNPVLETQGSVTVQVSRQGGTSTPISVVYSTADGTDPNAAKAGVNYTATTGTLTWANGEMGTKSFKVPILNTGVYFANLAQFSVNIATADPTLIPGPTSALVSIQNTTETSTLGISPTSYVVDESGQSVTLTVVRTVAILPSGTIPAVSVNYATIDGSATAGVDYTATAGTLSWAAGDTSPKTITVPILENSQISLDRLFTVALSNPSTNATIATGGSTATVTIKNDDIDKNGPIVSVVQLAGSSTSFNQIVLTFNESLSSTTATDTSNYIVTDPSGTNIPVNSAQYLATSNSVVLTIPTGVTKSNLIYKVFANGSSPNGLQDLYGNFLNGTGSGNNTNFIDTVARGTNVTYNDNMNNKVNITLNNGYFDLVRYADGHGRGLSLYNTSTSTVLNGTVKRLNAASTGYTVIEYMSGVTVPNKVKIALTQPPFVFYHIYGANPALPAGMVSASKLMAARLRRGK